MQELFSLYIYVCVEGNFLLQLFFILYVAELIVAMS